MSDTVSRIVIEADGSIARREFASVGDAATEVGYDIRAGIGKSLDATAASFEKLDAKIASGSLRGLPVTITQSAVAVENLRAEMEQLRASGADVTQLSAAVERYEQKLKEATTAAGRLRDKQEEVNRTVRASANAADFGLGKLGTNLGSTLELMSKLFFVANIVGQSLSGIAKALDSVQGSLGLATDGTREENAELAKLGQSIASLDLVGFSEALGRYAGALSGGADATDELAEANRRWGESMDGPAGKLAAILAAQREIESSRKARIESLATESAAIVRTIAVEEEKGEVTKQTKDRVAELLEAYERIGVTAPEKLIAAANAHGILAGKAKESADAVKSLAEQWEGSAEKLKARDEQLIKAIELVEKDGVVTQQAAKGISASLDEQLAAYAKLGEAPPAIIVDLADKFRSLAGAVSSSSGEVAKIREELLSLEKAAQDAVAKYEEIATAGDSNTASVERLKNEIHDLQNKDLTKQEDIDRLDKLKEQLRDATSWTTKRAQEAERAKKEDAAWNEVLKVREQIDQANTRAIDASFAARERERAAIAAQSKAEGELYVTMGNVTEEIAGRGIVISNLKDETAGSTVAFDELTRTLKSVEKPLDGVATAGEKTAASMKDVAESGPAAAETLERVAKSTAAVRADMEWMKANAPELASLIAQVFAPGL